MSKEGQDRIVTAIIGLIFATACVVFRNTPWPAIAFATVLVMVVGEILFEKPKPPS